MHIKSIMKTDILAEYKKVTRDLETIRNEIIALKNITEKKMHDANTDDERSNIFVEFKGKLDKIQQDKTMKKNYKKLAKRKMELELTINETNTESTESDCDQLESSANDNIGNIEHSSDTENKNVDDPILCDIDIMIKKYKKFIRIPIIYRIDKQNNEKKQKQKQKEQKERRKSVKAEDIKQMKKLQSLIESLKMEVN